MAKIKLQGHASGSGIITLTAPNTSTDRTISLPDSTGTLLDTTSGLDATKLSGNLPALNGSSLTSVNAVNNSRKNLVINGEMQVFQRATGATASTTTYKTADRWMLYDNSSGAFTSERHNMSLAELNTTGHSQALALNVTTADTSIGSSEFCFVRQMIEAQNLQQLQYGTAAAKDLTLSFWVKSKIAGIYCVQIYKVDSPGYAIPKEYTINNVDTWEYKTITYTPTAGSTSFITNSGGIINNDNGSGMQLTFGLVWGSTYQGTNNTWTTAAKYATSNQVNWMSSTSNDFYLTGVQLETGSVATDFEHRSYGEELALCKRYFEKQTFPGESAITIGVADSGGGVKGDLHYSEKRAVPTVTIPSSGLNQMAFLRADANWPSTHGTFQASAIGNVSCRIRVQSGGGYVAGNASWLYNTPEKSFTFDAEL